MFPRSLRLSRMGFEQSRGLPRTVTPHFSISYGSSRKAAGFGVIVPKKIAKSSVERHLLKRRVREVVREFLKGKNLPGTVVIVSARAGAPSLPFGKIKEELSEAFKAILLETKS